MRPESRRGRFIGAYSTMSMGFRAGSGILIGVLGALLGVTGAVAIDAIALLAVALRAAGDRDRLASAQRTFDAPERASSLRPRPRPRRRRARASRSARS